MNKKPEPDERPQPDDAVFCVVIAGIFAIAAAMVGLAFLIGHLVPARQ